MKPRVLIGQGRILALALLLSALVVPCLAFTLMIKIKRVDTLHLPILRVEFLILKEDGKLISGITRNELSLLIDGQKRENFSLLPQREKSAATSCFFLMQTNDNMRGDPFYQAKQLVGLIVDRLTVRDQIALVSFDQGINTYLDKTEDKYRLNDVLNTITLRPGSLTIYDALNSLLNQWDETTLKNSTIIICIADLSSEPTALKIALLEKLKRLNIRLCAVSVKSSAQNFDFRNFIRMSNGSYFNYRKEADIWSIYKDIDMTSDVSYVLQIEQAHQIDYLPHTLTIMIDLFDLRTSAQVTYIGAPGTGLNPQASSGSYLYGQTWFLFFFLSFGAFITVGVLFMLERSVSSIRLRPSAYFYAALAGALAGYLFTRLIS